MGTIMHAQESCNIVKHKNPCATLPAPTQEAMLYLGIQDFAGIPVACTLSPAWNFRHLLVPSM